MIYSKAEQLGKKKLTRIQHNVNCNVKLKKLFKSKKILKCELTRSSFALAYAHRHPRVWYYSKPKLMYAFEQVLLLSQKAHQKMDDRSQTTEAEKEAIFIRLRGK